ncbi:MAG: glutamine synthetase III [Bacteroidales bacterium]|nr:glutamine synthetase III [Bacteroidales bacterium]MCF8389255.1 glutamine synthetase III [Bacteroidales bacterium]
MAYIRFEALKEVFTREPHFVTAPSPKVSDYYGEKVFDNQKMRKYLSEDVYKKVVEAMDKGERIDRKVADQVASGMKAWAMEHGVTHYTHWFHPLTEGTAEKHDAFMDPIPGGGVVENFSGKLLAQQEPDASSFPSGGIRNTFEARGYTAWDPTSPAFIVGNTLSIPTIFVSYTGETLDSKTPLLKALAAVDKAATEVALYFDRNVTKVFSNLGWEQEYFLIDEALYNARPDLYLTGRTLMGHSSAKDQQLDDHYFSSIPERVKAFMYEFEIEAFKLGIPVKTRHNEVAPNQYECAPVYEETNIAVDHNLLVMDLMKKIARRHKFRVLFHEKPFSGINGSGKHNNWSLATDTGINLLSPGKTPRSNTMFLTFLINTILAVYKYQDLLRASIASSGNAHRLGANEAPPAIISAFLGTQISAMLDELEDKVTSKKMTPDEKTELKLNIGKIPEILLDNTDRNRTSPFAFTGNRFEFRAVGSSANCSSPMIALNTAVADQLTIFKADVDKIIEKGVKKDEAIFQVLRKYIIESKPIRFDGNNYSDEWAKEAAKRGLTNIKDIPEALLAYLKKDVIDLFVRQDVMSERELEARTEVKLEAYTMKVQIESRVLGDLVMNHIVPIAIDYQTSLVDNVAGLKDLFDHKEFTEMAGARLELIKEISSHISYIKAKVKEMTEARKVANAIEDSVEKAHAYSKVIFPYLDDIRYHVDKLELIVDDEMWPLPKYRELLFAS